MDWNKYQPYFIPREFHCRHCGEQHMTEAHMDKLFKARVIAGIPFRISSGWRCEHHNENVGGGPEHPMGHASDIICDWSRNRFIIISSLLEVGFNRIGIARSFIHAGSSPDLAQRVTWVYGG